MRHDNLVPEAVGSAIAAILLFVMGVPVMMIAGSLCISAAIHIGVRLSIP